MSRLPVLLKRNLMPLWEILFRTRPDFFFLSESFSIFSCPQCFRNFHVCAHTHVHVCACVRLPERRKKGGSETEIETDGKTGAEKRREWRRDWLINLAKHLNCQFEDFYFPSALGSHLVLLISLPCFIFLLGLSTPWPPWFGDLPKW